MGDRVNSILTAAVFSAIVIGVLSVCGIAKYEKYPKDERSWPGYMVDEKCMQHNQFIDWIADTPAVFAHAEGNILIVYYGGEQVVYEFDKHTDQWCRVIGPTI